MYIKFLRITNVIITNEFLGFFIAPGKFRRYDYSFINNLLKYGTFDPPKYDLGKIKVPVSLHYGINDWLANVKVRIFLYITIYLILNVSDIFARIFIFSYMYAQNKFLYIFERNKYPGNT